MGILREKKKKMEEEDEAGTMENRWRKKLKQERENSVKELRLRNEQKERMRNNNQSCGNKMNLFDFNICSCSDVHFSLCYEFVCQF